MSDNRVPAFVAVYAGADVTSARLLAASSDPDLVETVARRLLERAEPDPKLSPVEATLMGGRRAALRLVAGGEEVVRP